MLFSDKEDQMRTVDVCGKCGKMNFDYIEGTHYERCFCRDCGEVTNVREKIYYSPYERTRAAVYATGNRWAIENFHATHD